jgi:hypothetical protein
MSVLGRPDGGRCHQKQGQDARADHYSPPRCPPARSTACSPSNLPYAVENLRMCGCSLEQLVQNDLNDCPHCGRRLPAVER